MNDRIGPYEIVREVGRGGMGVVSLARDTRLGRDVAIKALPEHLAADPARLERFEREARTLASLHHPNVAGIYSVEEQDGARNLALEYVDGPGLDEIIDRGPLSVDDTLAYAIDIAAGLEAAHDAGIVHRDLKPANIKITPDGVAKVLDFGLARMDERSSITGELEQPITATQPQNSPTIEGAILGTAAYMSPEQARGRRVDTRTDTWAFGVVLYEMLVGVSPFQGETATDSIGAVLHKDVELDRLPSDLAPAVRRLIRRCLHRDKSKRIQSIGDARIELAEVVSGESPEDEVAGAVRPKTAWYWPAAVVVLLIGAVGAWALKPSGAGPGEDAPARTRAQITGVQKVLGSLEIGIDHALSPDGRVVLFSAEDGGDSDIFFLRVGGENPINLTPDSPGDDFSPAWSPDGERIAYVSSSETGGIFVMGATGENPRRLTDDGFDPAWSPDGTRLVYTSANVVHPYGRVSVGALSVVDVESREATSLKTGETTGVGDFVGDAVGPEWSPDGRWIAFWNVADGRRDLQIVPSGGGDRIAITNDGPTDWNPIWGPASDRLYFMSDRNGATGVWSIDIDTQTGAPIGDPFPVMAGPTDVMNIAISADGTRLIIGTNRTRSSLARVPFDADEERIDGTPKVFYNTDEEIVQPDFTPDGEWVVYRTEAPREDIIVLRTDGTGRRQLTNDIHRDRGPIWSPIDGGIVMYSNRGGAYEFWRMDRDGTDLRRMPVSDAIANVEPHISTDGRMLSGGNSTADGTEVLLFDRREDGMWIAREQRIPQFYARGWSPDSRCLSGEIYNLTDPSRIALYDMETDEIVPFRAGDDDEGLGGLSYQSWIDANRVLFWDHNRRRLAIGDARTMTVRFLDELGAGAVMAFSILDATELILLRNERETALWMIELGEGS